MLRRILAPFLLAIAATLTLHASQGQTGPPTSATGRIAGTVVAAESGRPVRFAKVTLSPGNREGVTDDAGAFSFERLSAASYELHVSKAGYLETSYGQTRPGTDTPGKRIRLRDREQLDRLVVPLSQGGSISGVIRDERGDPAFNASVRVSRWVMRHGLRTLETVASTETDERGMYRVSMLPPREYVVSGSPADDAIPESKTGPHPYGFAPMFYPATTSAQAAATIVIGLGEDRADIDLLLPLMPLGRVTGTVLDASGRPAPGAVVSLVEQGAISEEASQTEQADSNGRFTFDKVLPATYNVRADTGAAFRFSNYSVSLQKGKGLVLDGRLSVKLAHTMEVKPLVTYYEMSGVETRDLTLARETIRTLTADSAAAGRTRSSAWASVSVNGGAASDLVLTLEPARTVAGSVVFEGASAKPSAPGLRVVLTAISDSAEQLSVKVADDGTFVVPNVASGRYAVSVLGESSPWTLASAIYGGAEVLDTMLDVPRNRDVNDLTMTLRDRSTELSGTVTNAAGQPAADRTVVVFAAEERLWSAGVQRIQSAELGEGGRFSFARLRPGSYRLAVVEAAEPDEWLDPAFLRQLLAASVAVTIGDGEKKVQDLRVR